MWFGSYVLWNGMLADGFDGLVGAFVLVSGFM